MLLVSSRSIRAKRSAISSSLPSMVNVTLTTGATRRDRWRDEGAGASVQRLRLVCCGVAVLAFVIARLACRDDHQVEALSKG